ncbi:MAG: hypothetical protein Q8O37_11115 [Sulfuricellaceae bacterium]|nr:hypothetical protein [Sulfuricellaceae bacterium]
MIGDREHLQHQLEAMKMSQATLQQLMTLSAGGLALFFSFIGKAPFVLAIQFFGPAVVTAWIISLSTAAYAHRLHAELFLSLARIVGVNREIDALGDFANEVASELKINPNSAGVVERAKVKIESTRNWARAELNDFDKSFFIKQSRALRLIRVSLFMLVFGFVQLGIGYVVSSFAP